MIRPEELSSNRIHNSIANTYGYNVNANISARLKYELALKYVKHSDNVLDVGCANGIHMRLLAKECNKITGVDINDAMIEIACATLAADGIANARLARRSATDLGIPDESIDLAYSFSTLLLIPDVDRALEEISRVLRPGGVAILDITGRWNLSRVYWGLYYRRHGHFGLHSFGYKEIVSRLKALDLKVVESHALGFLDQWRYIPGLHWCKWLDRYLHASVQDDLDYRMSNRSFVFPFANRWYLACRKSPERA